MWRVTGGAYGLRYRLRSSRIDPGLVGGRRTVRETQPVVCGRCTCPQLSGVRLPVGFVARVVGDKRL